MIVGAHVPGGNLPLITFGPQSVGAPYISSKPPITHLVAIERAGSQFQRRACPVVESPQRPSFGRCSVGPEGALGDGGADFLKG